jgi:SnoaL-like protein
VERPAPVHADPLGGSQNVCRTHAGLARVDGVAVARAHAEAWSNHDWDAARASLAADVHVTATSTQPIMPTTDLTGADAYMDGLIAFAQAVVPGSARVIASVGDARNALLVLTVEADFGHGRVTLPAARLYLLDDDDKRVSARVVGEARVVLIA